ncbi:MAG: hypothetical protein WC314_11180 [Vulcanimicrobiota bacterium]
MDNNERASAKGDYSGTLLEEVMRKGGTCGRYHELLQMQAPELTRVEFLREMRGRSQESAPRRTSQALRWLLPPSAGIRSGELLITDQAYPGPPADPRTPAHPGRFRV